MFINLFISTTKKIWSTYFRCVLYLRVSLENNSTKPGYISDLLDIVGIRYSATFPIFIQGSVSFLDKSDLRRRKFQIPLMIDAL